MKKRYKILSLTLSIIVLQSIISNNNNSYKSAVNDAKNAYPDKVRNLSPLAPTNKNTIWKNGKVLMASVIPEWAVNQFYLPALEAGGDFTTPTIPGVFVWATSVPQLKNFIANYRDKRNVHTDPNLLSRVQMLLGLPLKEGNFYITQFWVDQKNVFRPCPDAEIDDLVCEADTIKNKPTFNIFQNVKSTPQHRNWYNNEKKTKYNEPNSFPWTRLGYTYDYYKKEKSDDPKGLSEYVIKQNTPIQIESITPLNMYY